MKVATFLTVKAVISLFFGLLLALVPGLLMGFVGGSLDPSGIYMSRLVGACLIGIGLICWLCRDTGPHALRGITLSLAVGDTIGFIVVLMAQLGGLQNALGWVLVLIWLLLAAGNWYFRFTSLRET